MLFVKKENKKDLMLEHPEETMKIILQVCRKLVVILKLKFFQTGIDVVGDSSDADLSRLLNKQKYNYYFIVASGECVFRFRNRMERKQFERQEHQSELLKKNNERESAVRNQFASLLQVKRERVIF